MDRDAQLGSPEVSVILPAHNAGPYLRESLWSISAQTFRDFEIIAVDDGSTDETPQILREYARVEPRLRIIQQANRGGAAARNVAVGAARAPLIAWMDADDIAVPERLELQVDHLKQHPDHAVLGGWLECIDEGGRATGEVLRLPPDHDQIAAAMASAGSQIADPTAMLRRDAFLNVGGYRPHLRTAYDFDLWLRLLPRSRFANLQRVLVRYRRHEQQTTRRAVTATVLIHFAAMKAYRDRQAGASDRLERWDGRIDEAAIESLGLDPAQRAYAYALMVDDEATEPRRGIAPHGKARVLELLWRTPLRGDISSVGLRPLVGAARHFFTSGQRLRALCFVARLAACQPRQVVGALIRKSRRLAPGHGK